MASVAPADAPRRLVQGAGRYPQPVTLLARLGVDLGHEGHGVATGMIQDLFTRLVSLSDEIGCRGLLIHCETTDAMRFYLRVVPEFERSPTDEMHLCLLMKDIRNAIG